MTAQPSDAPTAPAASELTVDYPVFYVAEAAAAAVRGARRVRIVRIVSLGVSLAVVAGFYFFFRDQWAGISWVLLGASLLLPVGFLAWAVVKEVVARREASRVTGGLAVGVTRAGLLLRSGLVPWDAVRALPAVSRALGRSAELRVQTDAGTADALPLDYLSVRPSTLDSAIRALSGGRRGIDFSALDA